MSSTCHWIMTIINQAIKQGLPNEQLVNWIKPIFKGDRNKVSNYCTIMVSSTIAMLYSTSMEQKVSAWVECPNKQALGCWFQTKTLHGRSYCYIKGNYG